jgi:hypothetical protein
MANPAPAESLLLSIHFEIRHAYKTAKAPTTAATIPTPPTAQSTFPAAPVESTREAEAEADLATDPDADTLALSFSISAAPLAKVGIVLTHDLLMLKLPVVTAEVVDVATKVGRSFVLVVEAAVELASQTAEFEVEDAALESLEVAMGCCAEMLAPVMVELAMAVVLVAELYP